MKKIWLSLLALASAGWGDDAMELLIGPEEIDARIQEVANQLVEEYRGEPLTIVMIMKGSLCLVADLIRALPIPCTVDAIRASSYGKNGIIPGELYITGIDQLDLADKNVLVVDDILDTGNTMATIVAKLQLLKPKSLKSLVLLLKNVSRLPARHLPDFILFHLENRFVVGYGLDYKELYRNLPGIYAFVGDKPPF